MSDNSSISLVPVPGTYTIHRLHTGKEIPLIKEGFHSVTITDEEVSLVCLDETEVESEKSSSGWKCLRVSGPLELNLVGILHDLTRPLKEAGISVFAISTYDTDYFLIPQDSYDSAILVLSDNYVIYFE